MKLWQKESGLSCPPLWNVSPPGRTGRWIYILAPYDVLGSLVHLAMLEKVKLVTPEEASALRLALLDIYQEIAAGKFVLEAGVEDVHSQVELLLTRRVGEAGKKIHTGRSRNDQVLTDLKLFFRAEIEQLTDAYSDIF